MQVICGIIGFIIGIVIFVLLLDKMHFLFTNFISLMLIFTVCVGIGCFFAYILGWLFIIILIIGAIYLLFFSKDSKEDNNQDNKNSSNEDSNNDSNKGGV